LGLSRLHGAIVLVVVVLVLVVVRNRARAADKGVENT